MIIIIIILITITITVTTIYLRLAYQIASLIFLLIFNTISNHMYWKAKPSSILEGGNRKWHLMIGQTAINAEQNI